MAILKPNSIFSKISGSIGKTLTIRNVGNTTIASAKPSRPRKRSRKPRSPRQLENSRKFKEAAYFSKRMIKIPEVHDYFKKMSVSMGSTNNAYTAVVKLYRETPDLTPEKLMDMVRTPPEENAVPESGFAFSVTLPNGDTIAQGVAVSAGKGQWTYTAPFTGVQVTIRDVRS